MKANTIEKNFKNTLNIIAAMNLSAEQIKENSKLYNALAFEAMEFFGKVALLSSRNRACINSTGIEFDEFVSDVTMHLLRNLDTVLACDESGRIPFIINMTNNKVIDKVRAWNRIYGTTKPKSDKNNYSDFADESDNARVCFLDETAWGFIADKTDIEQSYENNEMARLTIKVLANKAKSMEAVAFMATTILGWKTSELADKLIENGYRSVLFEVLSTVMNTFNISPDIFASLITDCNNNEYTFNMDIKKLAADLSRKSYTAKETVKKILSKEF